MIYSIIDTIGELIFGTIRISPQLTINQLIKYVYFIECEWESLSEVYTRCTQSLSIRQFIRQFYYCTSNQQPKKTKSVWNKQLWHVTIGNFKTAFFKFVFNHNRIWALKVVFIDEFCFVKTLPGFQIRVEILIKIEHKCK